jgi:hypothetical protein
MNICKCGATRFNINLNDHVRFKPAEFGKTIYKLHWLPHTKNKEGRNIELDIELDGDGYADLQIM